MRAVPEWIGKTDDSKVPDRVKLRVLDEYKNKCALSGVEFKPGDKIEFDHITPLWMGGENREKNLQPVLPVPHKKKTSTEAAVRKKVNRIRKKHTGVKEKKPWSKFKKKMNGEVVER
ncbi:HNH endonuclease [Lentilitoribacter sp. Alg239-R112]|uniref:HNH endonuclease n=1 Tax=Lentilitoribacter sp. Alg239-R112 TaxID=2305987 RepID=UPI0013A6AD3C|nr:HNH endonuclease [Lentilitoribacter sp. Alg239-R112]